MFLWIVSWAARRGSGAGFMAIAALLILLVSVPMALLANVWMAKETGRWRFLWVFLASLAQALLIPAGVFVYFVIAP